MRGDVIMEIRQLKTEDAWQFSKLIIDMYSNLNNLEWFTPMPYDKESVASIIENPRFYIVGLFENENLVAVSSLDYKCGKLIGKIDFPKACNTDKLVEMAFNIVHSKHRGHGYMKLLLDHLMKFAKENGFEWVFGKVHKDNMASKMSFIRKDFEVLCDYNKHVDKEEFIGLANQEFFCEIGKENAKQTLERCADQDEIDVDYNILIKKL